MKILNLDSSPRGEIPCKEAREWFSQKFPKGATVPQLIRACVILFPLMWTEHEPLTCWIGDLRKLLHDDVEFLHSFQFLAGAKNSVTTESPIFMWLTSSAFFYF